MYRAFLILFALPALATAQAPQFLLKDGQRVVFLGDSNTFAGTYIAYLDAFLYTRFPDKKFELINLGLPSETVSGLSEPDHPYPRPGVHERLDQALARSKPDVVIVCYGMNDGIYYPFSEDRFAKYRDGVERLANKIAKVKAKLVLMTPAPFDPLPLKKIVRPLGDNKYSWMKPYENYDETLAKYSAWLVTLRDKGFVVADAHSAVRRFLAEVRKSEPSYFVSGDGIHPNPTGHAVIAFTLLQALNAPDEADLAEIDFKMQRGINGKVKDVAVGDKEIRFEWTAKLPMPTDPRWHARFGAIEKWREALNRHELIVSRAPNEEYTVYEGETKLGNVSRNELKLGVDMTRFADLSLNRRAAELWPLVEKRQKLLGVAWLTDVGHKRPDTPKGIALVDAQKQAADLDRRIRELAQPQTLKLRLVAK